MENDNIEEQNNIMTEKNDIDLEIISQDNHRDGFTINVVDSKGVHYGFGVSYGLGIFKGYGVDNSAGIYFGKGIQSSHGVCQATGVIMSGAINESYNIVKAYCICDSYGISASNTVYSSQGVSLSRCISNCYYIKNCDCLLNSVMCIGISGQNYLFNKQVSKERMTEIINNIKCFADSWYPKFTNALDLYKENGEEWENVPVSMIKGVDDVLAYEDMPEALIRYIKSLLEFDAEIFEEITGVKV